MSNHKPLLLILFLLSAPIHLWPMNSDEIRYDYRIYERASVPGEYTIFAFAKKIPPKPGKKRGSFTNNEEKQLTFAFTGSKEEAKQVLLEGIASLAQASLTHFKEKLLRRSNSGTACIQAKFVRHSERLKHLTALKRKYKKKLQQYDSNFLNPQDVEAYIKDLKKIEKLPNPFILQYCMERAEELKIKLTED